ncbi:amino acid permease [Clostridium sp. chh4-2]|uniref:APC family permease n=1 Tax=Clostridium sp. chh4-2 TaxID=2067550 RepID=UPI000CCF1980|nr:amino acid permease [Clostridium sp. chh4-2]PNV60887.1 amino acid permease [Clostridium sp. chh4-2]
MQNNTQNDMKRTVGVLQGLSIVIGMIIGSGIFLKPTAVLRDAGSPKMAILLWVVGGIISLCAALSVAEIGSNMPRAGGLYNYLEELYGEKWGFTLGWVQSIISYPAELAAQSIAIAIYATYFVPMTAGTQRMLALGMLFMLLVLNILSTKYGGAIQVASTFGKLVPFVAIICMGLFKGHIPGAAGMSGELIGESLAPGAALLGTLWAYDGWLGVTNMAGEMKDPKKNLPRSIFLGVMSVIVVYVLFNLVILRTLPADAILTSETPAADAAEVLFGPGGAAFLTGGILISIFGSLNGHMMTGARVPQSMAARGQLPCSRLIGKVNPKFGTPTNALIAQSLIAVFYIMSGTFHTLSNLATFVLWIFFTAGIVGVFLLRKRGLSDEKGYRIPLYPITPVLGALGSSYILLSTLFGNPSQSIFAIVVALLGLPLFSILKKRNSANNGQ